MMTNLFKVALRHLVEYLEKAKYRKSYQRACEDRDILSIAEEGMEDYLNQLKMRRAYSTRF